MRTSSWDEIVNRTAHAGALSALVEAAAGYRFYFGAFVLYVSRFTPLYLAAINPFRKGHRLTRAAAQRLRTVERDV